MIQIKVLHICSYYISSNLYQKMFNAMKSNDIEQDVYVFTDNKYKIKKDYPEYINISKCYNKIDRFIFHLKHLKVLKDIKVKMKIKDYEIIHAHSLFSNGYIAYKLNKEYNIPYIVAVRNTDVNLFFSKMIHLRSLGVNILKNAEKVVFISEPYREHTIDRFIKDIYKKEIQEKSKVIPNGIDNFWFNNKFNKRKIPKKNKIKIIYVGKVNRNKNIETTTKACELLIKMGYKVDYKIIGKITDEKYKNFIRSYSFIKYIEHCTKENLIEHYRNSDIFVMPSKHETFGLVYVESMSQGLPVIYTRTQGFDGYFKEGQVGYSVSHDSEKEIVKNVLNILDNYTEISDNCLKNIDKFNWHNIAKEYVILYKEN